MGTPIQVGPGQAAVEPGWWERNRRTVGIILAVIILAALIWMLWGFWMKFIGLTLVYCVVALGLTWAAAWFAGNRNNEETGEVFQRYLRNNNTYWFWLAGMALVTFVIALFHFGPATLLPENTPSPGQRGAFGHFLDELWLGDKAPPKKVPTEPLSWATGTWFWWKAWALYAFLTFAYFWFAFWDEASHGLHAVAGFIHARLEAEEHGRHAQPAAAAGAHGAAPVAGQRASFWQILSIGLIADIAMEFFTHFIARRRGNI